MTKARDLSKLLSTANGKIAGANLDVSFENIADTGTEGTKVAYRYYRTTWLYSWSIKI
jgi:hypothetical protein